MGEFVGTGDLNNIPLRSAISLSALLCKPKGSVVASNALPRCPLKGEELKKEQPTIIYSSLRGLSARTEGKELNMDTDKYNPLYNQKELKEKRRELRSNSTSTEAVLWRMLKGKQIEGKRWRRQFSIGNYILDFYSPEMKLAIELDGNDHYTIIGKFNDERREEYLNALGITIIRFENKDIWCSTDLVIETIREYSLRK